MKTIGIGLIATLSLLGPQIAAAEMRARSAADVQLAQGGGPGMTGSSGGGQSNAGTAIGPPKDDPPAAVAPPGQLGGKPESDVSAGTNRGDTGSEGRASHGGTSGTQRPLPTAAP